MFAVDVVLSYTQIELLKNIIHIPVKYWSQNISKCKNLNNYKIPKSKEYKNILSLKNTRSNSENRRGWKLCTS